jgi:hypothetical protein
MLKKTFWVFIAGAIFFGCMPPEIPKEALQLADESPARRKLESRRFETQDERALFDATRAVLKELEFNVDASSKELGLIAASKKEKVHNVGEMAASAAVAVISSALSFPTSVPYSKDQLLRVSVVTKLAADDHGIAVRVTFQRVVWDTEGQVAKSELLEDLSMYQNFFGKLAKAVALEAHEF